MLFHLYNGGKADFEIQVKQIKFKQKSANIPPEASWSHGEAARTGFREHSVHQGSYCTKEHWIHDLFKYNLFHFLI